MTAHADETVEQREHTHSWWECGFVQTLWEFVWRFLRKMGVVPHQDLAIRQKLNRELRELTDVLTQMDVTEICRTFHMNIKEYTFFSAPDGTFSKIDHILDNKVNLNRYQEIGITPCILSDHRGLKLEFKSNTNFRKLTNTWKLNNAHRNHQ